MYDVVDEKKPFEFKDLRAAVAVTPIKDTDIPHRLIRKNVKVDNKTIPVLLQPKVPNLKTVRAVAAAGYSTGTITTQELKRRYPNYFVHRPIPYQNVREMTDPYNALTRRQFTDCSRTDPTAAPALRKRNNAFLRNGFVLKLRPKGTRNPLTGMPMTPEEMEMEGSVWNQQYSGFLSQLDVWANDPKIKLLEKIKAAHYVGTVQGRFLTKHFPPLSLLEQGALPETLKVISAEEMGNVIIDRMTEDIVAVRIFSVDEENFTLLPDEFVYVALNDSALTRYERFYGRSDMEPVIQLSRINKHITNIGYAKAFEAAYMPKVIGKLPVEGTPEQKIDQLQKFASYISGAKDVVVIEQSEFGDIQAYPQEVNHEMVVAIRKDLDEIILGALGSTKAQISRTENLTRDNATIMEIENKRNIIKPDEEIYARAFEEQLLNPLFAHITGIPLQSLPVEVYIEPIPDEDNILDDLDEKKADEGKREGIESSESGFQDEKEDEVEHGSLEQNDRISSLGATGKKSFDENKHKRDEDGKFAKKEGVVELRRREDKNLERKQETKMQAPYDYEEYTNTITEWFDRQRYDVKVTGVDDSTINLYTGKNIASKVSDVLDNVPDEYMEDIKTVKIDFAEGRAIGSYDYINEELAFNIPLIASYGKGGKYEFLEAITRHEIAHVRFMKWSLDKRKRWAERMKEVGPINSYTERMILRDEVAQEAEDDSVSNSYSKLIETLKPLQEKMMYGSLGAEDEINIDTLKKRLGLTSDAEFLDGTVEKKIEEFLWLKLNFFANEQHSAIFEVSEGKDVLGEKYRIHYDFDEDKFKRAVEIYEKEFKGSDVGAAGRTFDENKHKRDEKGRWAKKDSNALKRKKDKRLESQHIRPDKLGSMRKWANEIERTFDRQRYKVRVDIRNQNLSLSNILDTTTMLSKILDKVPDKDMEKVKKIVLKTGGENVSTGSYSFNKKEMMFNLEHMHKYGGKRKREFMQAIVDHEVAHARFAEWDLDKMKRWKALTEEVGPINTYVESMKKYDKKFKKQEDNLALKSFNLNHSIVKSLQGRLRDAIAAGGAVDSYDRSEIDFYKNYLELDSDEEFLSKDVNDRYEKYSWLRWNKYANEQHSALFEEYHSNVIEDSGYYHDSYGRDRLNKMKEKYHAEFEK